MPSVAERVIFREFYPRGLTALDALDETTLGTRPTLSHVTARLEIDNLLKAINLSSSAASGETAGARGLPAPLDRQLRHQ
jgi:chromosome partitioning protein